MTVESALQAEREAAKAKLRVSRSSLDEVMKDKLSLENSAGQLVGIIETWLAIKPEATSLLTERLAALNQILPKKLGAGRLLPMAISILVSICLGAGGMYCAIKYNLLSL